MTPEDVKTTRENHQLLALIEREGWRVFVDMVDRDMQALDRISSLVLENRPSEDILREVMVRYQTRESVIKYINDTILRAESALQEIEEQKSDIINIRES
jgi:hypothetical protein